ncbi:unnamed protein product [Linum tenue]|uniref:Inhibitor I9 domain-containing protein n=1 Tax=Linum tenue TaxID=586396 RepID=A0AAV0JJA3_9ROSI|nr:unnamed protein product [Linum tenue]
MGVNIRAKAQASKHYTRKAAAAASAKMESSSSVPTELYFVFMNYDPQYDRLRADRTKRGAHELDVYLSRKHDALLSRTLELGTYTKTCSLVIVDGFKVQITEDQANVLRSAEGVRLVEKNQELA